MSVLYRIPPRLRHIPAPVQRLLPHARCRKVGPWVFLDRFGPVTAVADPAMDVLPHPHCSLSTVSYLFAGEVEHRDSTGGHARIRPGEVHWMRAGHGIVHSERVPEDQVGETGERFGLQLWCAHPDGAEEQEPGFDSYTQLPELDVSGVRVQLLAGDGWGAQSPVAVTSRMVFALAHLRTGQRLALPDHAERCVVPLHGEVAVGGERTEADLLVVEAGAGVVHAVRDALLLLLGGEPIGARHMWWNLVHSDEGRLAEQAERWRRGEFPAIPGDSDDFVPAPPGPRAR
ncbi:MAG: pirin family protein [Myxococcales bacterium]|nr:pirin family protein [Myxococcales bacterium]